MTESVACSPEPFERESAVLEPRHLASFPMMEMRFVEGRGRFLVAAHPIAMGETVCVSPPYCRAVTGTVKRMVCSHCYKSSTNRLPLQCTGCREVSFCSSRCMERAMEQHVPLECEALKRMTRTRGRDQLDLDDVRVILNMLNKRHLERTKHSKPQVKPEKVEEMDPISTCTANENSIVTTAAPSGAVTATSTEHHAIEHIDVSPAISLPATANEERQESPLDSSVHDMQFQDVVALVGEADMLPNPLERKVFEEAASFLLRIVGEPLKEGLDRDDVKGLFLKSRFNRFGKWSKRGTAMGFGVFPFVSYFNHSCIPNLRRYQGEDFGLLEIRALRDIETGEELCISYTDLYLSTQDRRAVLRDYFGFTCMCSRCTDTTDASDQYILDISCPSRFCQELLLPLKECSCTVYHCRHCGIIKPKHRPAKHG